MPRQGIRAAVMQQRSTPFQLGMNHFGTVLLLMAGFRQPMVMFQADTAAIRALAVAPHLRCLHHLGSQQPRTLEAMPYKELCLSPILQNGAKVTFSKWDTLA